MKNFFFQKFTSHLQLILRHLRVKVCEIVVTILNFLVGTISIIFESIFYSLNESKSFDSTNKFVFLKRDWFPNYFNGSVFPIKMLKFELNGKLVLRPIQWGKISLIGVNFVRAFSVHINPPYDVTFWIKHINRLEIQNWHAA